MRGALLTPGISAVPVFFGGPSPVPVEGVDAAVSPSSALRLRGGRKSPILLRAKFPPGCLGLYLGGKPQASLATYRLTILEARKRASPAVQGREHVRVYRRSRIWLAWDNGRRSLHLSAGGEVAKPTRPPLQNQIHISADKLYFRAALIGRSNLSSSLAFLRKQENAMGLLESVVIFVIVIGAIFALIRLVPMPAPFGQVVNIILWVVVALFVVRLLFGLLGGGLGGLSLR